MNQLSQVSSNLNSLKLVGIMDSAISSKKEVRTIKPRKKCSKSGDIEVFNTVLIYSRVMCLLNIGIITLEDFFNYELPPILQSLFENTGDMGASKSKLDLKKHFKWGRLYAYNVSVMLLSLKALHNFSLHHCELMRFLKTLDMLFITLFCYTKQQSRTYTLCLTGTVNTPSKVLKEIKEQDPQLVILFCHSAHLFHK